MSIFYQLRVAEIKRETIDAVSVVFEIPDELKKEFSFLPGQYITLQKELSGMPLRRAYSICSSPNSGELRVAIKAVEKGRFSQFANKQLQEGDWLDVAAPEGRFVLETNPGNNKKYLALAAGSGITPVISMIKAVVEDEPNSEFVLVYGSKSKEKTIFHKDLLSLMEQAGERLKIHFVYSQIISDKALFGRIDKNKIKELLKGEYNNWDFDSYFVCGPEQMIETVKEELAKRNVAEDQIKFELFSSSAHKKEVSKSLDGNAKLSVILDDEELNLEMRQDEIILDALLAKGIDAPYSCQGGICSSCLAKVVEGEAVMEKNSILDDDEVEEGLILTCQAHPTSTELKIDFDDV